MGSAAAPGIRREQLLTEAGGQVQQMRDLLGMRLADRPGRGPAAVPVS